MGIDHSLTPNHPSVIINGRQYHYGKTPGYDEYLVENASYAKDYWCFKEEVDLQAFLVNLPQSADRNLRLKLHPDWHEVTAAQRDAYFEQDKLTFRAWAAEKVANGIALSFKMDLEGEHGPYEPHRIEIVKREESSLERVERQIVEYKLSSAMRAGHIVLPPGVALADLVYGAMELVFESGLSEAGKLRWLEGEIDWTGVSDEDRAAVLAREVDFSGITPEQFAFVYEDIEHEKFDPVDPRVATQLFQQALAAELQADAHAARVRDYGEADAGTYNQRVKEGASMPLTTASEAAASFKQRVERLWTTSFTDHETFYGDWSDLMPAEKLCFLAQAMDWENVPESYFLAMVERELTIAELPVELQAALQNPRGNRELFCEGFESASQVPQGGTGAIRDTTLNLVESIWLDVWPRAGAIVDFGLNSQAHYEALYYPVREGEITPEALDAALGKGEKLTALARAAPSNPHREITFRTSWDELMPVAAPEAMGEEGDEPSLPSPADIAEQNASAEPGLYQVWHDAGYPESRIRELTGGPAPSLPDDYVHVANVQTSSLEDAQRLTTDSGSALDGAGRRWVNNPQAQALVVVPRSTDVGDVIVDPKGIAYRCERSGFQRLEPAACHRRSLVDIACDARPNGQAQDHDKEKDRER